MSKSTPSILDSLSSLTDSQIRRNALARELSHSYSGDANALNPLAQSMRGLANALIDRTRPDFYRNSLRDIGGLLSEMSMFNLPKANMGLLSDNTPATEEERAKVLDMVNAFGPQNLGGFAGSVMPNNSKEIADQFVSKLRDNGFNANAMHWHTGSSYITVSKGNRRLTIPYRISDHPPSPSSVDLRQHMPGPQSTEEIDGFIKHILNSFK